MSDTLANTPRLDSKTPKTWIIWIELCKQHTAAGHIQCFLGFLHYGLKSSCTGLLHFRNTRLVLDAEMGARFFCRWRRGMTGASDCTLAAI